MKFEEDLSSQAQEARRGSRGRGFSLIEIVAVLAIVAILAAATLPVLTRQIDYATQGMERTNLVTLAAGFTDASLAQRYVPSQANWDSFIATNIGWQLNAVRANARNNSRAFLIDSNLAIATTTATTLPYSQPSTGANSVTNARFMILSSLPGGLPAGLASGVPSASDFNALWNNPEDKLPTGTSWSFRGQGADLKIQRINLASSFCHLSLTSADSTNAPYSIDSVDASSWTTLPPNTNFDAYFLKGTVLSLYFWSNGAPIVQAAQVLQQDTSWFFCGGLWRNAPCPSDLNLGHFGSIVQNFYSNHPLVTDPTTAEIFSEMTNYMGLYLQYASTGFTSTVARVSLQNAATALKNDTAEMLGP